MCKCKACGSDMPFELIPGTDQYEFLCDGCKTQHNGALSLTSWDFEGLFWEREVGEVNEELFNAAIKT